MKPKTQVKLHFVIVLIGIDTDLLSDNCNRARQKQIER